jgi:hypothetical protein
MTPWQLALVAAAGLFAAFIVWRVRPSLGRRPSMKAHREEFAAAQARVAKASSPKERALALCDAGDARAAMVGKVTSALGYYLRAMRSDPTSTEPIVRAARGLSRRPRALEAFLWRRLGASPWDGAHKGSALLALAELERIYGKSLRNRARASALRNAQKALGSPVDEARGAGGTEQRAAEPAASA